MHNLVQAWSYLYGNKVAILAGVTTVFMVAVAVMPSPDETWWSVQTAKRFIYDFSHKITHQEKPDPKA